MLVVQILVYVILAPIVFAFVWGLVVLLTQHWLEWDWRGPNDLPRVHRR